MDQQDVFLAARGTRAVGREERVDQKLVPNRAWMHDEAIAAPLAAISEPGALCLRWLMAFEGQFFPASKVACKHGMEPGRRQVL